MWWCVMLYVGLLLPLFFKVGRNTKPRIFMFLTFPFETHFQPSHGKTGKNILSFYLSLIVDDDNNRSNTSHVCIHADIQWRTKICKFFILNERESTLSQFLFFHLSTFSIHKLKRYLSFGMYRK